MALPYRPRKHDHQVPFLKAFTRLGKISKAAKAVRISRDAVHDWRRNDPVFAAAFLVAKHHFKHAANEGLIDAVDFFTSVVKPFVPTSAWPRVQSALAIAVSNIRFKERETLTGITPPQPLVDAMTSGAKATSQTNVSAFHHRY